MARSASKSPARKPRGNVVNGGFVHAVANESASLDDDFASKLLRYIEVRKEAKEKLLGSISVLAIIFLVLCLGVFYQRTEDVPPRDDVSLALVSLLSFLLLALLFHNQIFGVVTALFEKQHQLEDGVLIASLLESGNPDVGDPWHIHDNNAYKATPPRSKKWYKGVVKASYDNYFVVEVIDETPLPLDGSVQKTTRIPSCGVLDATELVALSKSLLFCVRYEDLTLELFAADNPSPTVESHKLAKKCRSGEIDWFVSHSWRDDAKLKWAALVEEADSFKAQNGRWPVIWLDKVCIDQANITQSLKCLPVYVFACKEMLVLGGPTYLSRLWCVWEMYTRFAIASGTPNVRIKEFGKHQSNMPGSCSSTGLRLGSAGTRRRQHLPFRIQLKIFMLKSHTKCYNPNEESKLMGAIRAAPGGEHAFNQTIQELASQLTTAAGTVT